MAENIFIKEPLDKPFAVNPINCKLRRVNKVRPASLLSNVIAQHKTMAERYTEIFPPLSLISLTG